MTVYKKNFTVLLCNKKPPKAAFQKGLEDALRWYRTGTVPNRK
jgi:hypothetical protein